MNVRQVLSHAGITYRQLDHWCSKGYILTVDATGRNPGSGQLREFTRQEAEKARIINCLTLVGFKVDAASNIAKAAVYQDTKTVFIGHGVTMLVEPHNH